MPDRATIVAAVQAYCRVQCEKDQVGWAALFADDVFHEDPVGLRSSRGKEHVVGPFWDSIVGNDVKIWLTDEVIVCGNEAMAILACEVGTGEQRRRMAPVIDHLIFDDAGLICSARGFYNLS